MKHLITILILFSISSFAENKEWEAIAKKANADAIEFNKFWAETDREIGKLLERKDDAPIFPSKAAYGRALKKLAMMPPLPKSYLELHKQVEKEIVKNPAFDFSALDTIESPNNMIYYRFASTLLFTYATGEYPGLKVETANVILKLVKNTSIETPSLVLLLLNDSLLTLAKEFKVISFDSKSAKRLEAAHQAVMALKEKSSKANAQLPENYADFTKIQRISNNQLFAIEFNECRKLSKEILAITSIATF